MRSVRLVRMSIVGLSPERMLSKIRRLGVGLYRIKKIEKDCLYFSVSKKDEPRVRALENSAYKISTVEKTEMLKTLKRRISLLVGGILFLAITCLSNSFVFAIDVVGAEGLEREVKDILSENGVRIFSPYKRNEEKLSSQILKLDGVAFCSVKKLGTSLKVEVLRAPFERVQQEKGNMLSSVSGTLLSLTVLSGTPLKKAGDSVKSGEPLVGAYLLTEDGKYREEKVVASAEFLVCYETEIACESAQIAYIRACFKGLGEIPSTEQILQKTVEKTDGGYYVKIDYTAVQSMNL